MKTVSRRYVDSSSFKMALLFTALLTISATILIYLVIDFGRRDLLRETRAALDIEISLLSRLNDVPGELVAYIQSRTERDQVVRFRYEDAAGVLLAGTIPALAEELPTLAEGVFSLELDTGQRREIFAARIYPFADGSRIVVARNVDELLSDYARLRQVSWLVMSLMLAVVLVSFGISHFVVSRINRIAATAQNIMETGDLSQRLVIDSRWDDLSNLSEVLNGFLDKIEDLMNGMREVSNNIAHDLRTPLSGLRSDIEALKSRAIDDQTIDDLLADADRILAIFHALLRITNIEKGKRSQAMGQVDLGMVVRDVAELYEPLAEERDIRLQLQVAANLTVRGDSDLLFQMFANVLDNAIKFAPGGSVIRVYAGMDRQQAMVSVEDQGPGVPDQEKDKVFKHFYRSDTSRSTPGNGLGLSLVRAVAELHHAKISLEDTHPGLKLRITFQPYQ